MKKFILQILFVLLFSISVPAQTENKQPILIDEFGETSSEDSAARLDKFINEISNAPDKKGMIRIYGENDDCFLCRYRLASWLDAYLKNTRKFSPERYSFEYCDVNEKGLRTQLYTLPKTSTLPKCEETLELPKTSALFDQTYFYSNDNKIVPLEDTIIDVVGAANGEFSQNVLTKVKILLDKSPESKIYILVYLGTNLEQGYYDEKKGYIDEEIRNLDRKSLAGKLFKNAKNEFVKNGINPSQIKFIEGGYVDDKRKLEFWFVPQGGEIPKPKPDYFPEKK